MANRTVMVDLKANTAAFQAAMHQAAGSMKGLDAEQAKAQKRAAMWSAVGKASTAAGLGIAAGLLYTTKAASAQEQALGALGAVFKNNTALMTANAQGATKIGLSTTQYANSAAKLGAQLGNLGIDESRLAGTTDDLIGKAADMAAQFGGPTSDAVDAIGAALRGERDPIERYGVALTEAGIQAEMAATGLSKADATLSLLNKQLAKSGTIGAAAREFDTTAAAAQRMQAEFQNAQAALGKALLPAMTNAANAASGLLGAFNNLSPAAQEAATYILGVGAAAMVIVPKIGAAASAIKSMQAAAAAGSTAASFGGIAAGMSVVVTASAGARLALDKLSDSAAEVTGIDSRAFDALASSIHSLVPGATGTTVALDRMLVSLGLMEDPLRSLPESYRTTGAELQSFMDKLNNGAGDQQAFADALAQGKSAAEAYAIAIEKGPVTLDRMAAAAARAAGAVNGALANAFSKAAAAARDESSALEALRDDLQGVVAAHLALTQATDAVYGSRRRLSAAFEENGKSLSRSTEAGLANRAVIEGEVGTFLKLGESLEATGMSSSKADAKVRQLIAGLRANAIAAGANRKELDALLRSILGLPKNANVKVALTGAKETERQLRGVASAAGKAARQWKVGLQLFGGKPTKKGLDDVKRAADRVPKHTNANTSAPGAKGARKDLDNVKHAADKVPPKATTNTSAPGAQGARSDLDRVKVAAQLADAVSPYITVSTNAGSVISQIYGIASAAASVARTYYMQFRATFGIAEGGPALGFASGGRQSGPVHGPGTSTSDSIPARLSRGEFVMNAAAVKKYGLGLMFALNARKLAGGGVPADLIDPVTKKRYTWADQRWIEYNPRRIPKGPSTRPVWDKPDQGKKESDKEYKARVEKKRARFERKVGRYQAKREALRDRQALINQEKLDAKWAARDDAAAAVQEAYEARVAAAQDKLDDIVSRRQQFQSDIYASMTGDWLGTFSFDAAAEATQRLTDAQQSLADARTAANRAAPEDRAAAMQEVAAARKEAAAAKAAAAAAAPTPKNILKAFGDRARQAKEYSAQMQQATNRGVSQDLLAELATAGPENAAPMLKALGAMTPAQIKQLNAQIQATKGAGLSLAGFMGTEFYGDQEAAARAALAAAQAQPQQVTVNIAGSAPISLTMDSREIWKGQLKLKRQTGNTYSFVRA